ncbi:MAG: hypothetical protein K2J14_01235, partial [Treponemataceae bacterium]|nr:hypothetical protein [Treponemataceae bacterium]
DSGRREGSIATKNVLRPSRTCEILLSIVSVFIILNNARLGKEKLLFRAQKYGILGYDFVSCTAVRPAVDYAD